MPQAPEQINLNSLTFQQRLALIDAVGAAITAEAEKSKDVGAGVAYTAMLLARGAATKAISEFQFPNRFEVAA